MVFSLEKSRDVLHCAGKCLIITATIREAGILLSVSRTTNYIESPET